MSSPPLSKWEPVELPEIKTHVGNHANWFLCGGYSIDLFVGRQTRSHSDVDIGIYRSEIEDALRCVENGIVYVCDPPGSVTRWNGEPIPEHVNDIWVASSEEDCWILQILIFTDVGEKVVFKRDKNVSWTKAVHTIESKGYRILNPAITLLYKASRGKFEEKDAMDITTLIDCYSERGAV
jgi:hypothetical protein